jgi:hypothetical protein
MQCSVRGSRDGFQSRTGYEVDDFLRSRREFRTNSTGHPSISSFVGSCRQFQVKRSELTMTEEREAAEGRIQKLKI